MEILLAVLVMGACFLLLAVGIIWGKGKFCIKRLTCGGQNADSCTCQSNLEQKK
ncbi:hypothetical protein ACFL2T_04530 [Elusimicrobiota bacterium]